MVYSKKFSGLCIVLLFLTGFVAQVSATNVEHTLEWDINGNLLQDDRYFYEYNGYNQLIKVRDGDQNGAILEEYWYDHEGQRIKKIEYSTNTTYYYIGKDFVQKHNDSGIFNTTYFYMNDKLVAKNDSGNMTFYHNDHLGSTTLITDSSGAEVAYQEYLPYGASLSDETAEERLYTGQTQDSTDLYYYGARYYNPELRRFTQPDPIIADMYDPQNLNRFSYVLNNPYKYTDPDGRTALQSIAHVALTSVFVFGIYTSVLYYQKTGELPSKGMDDYTGVSSEEAYFQTILDELSEENKDSDYLDNSPYTEEYKEKLRNAEQKQLDALDSISGCLNSYTCGDFSGNQDARDYSSENKYYYTTRGAQSKTKLGESSINSKLYEVYSPERDSEGKTEWDRIIEENKKKDE